MRASALRFRMVDIDITQELPTVCLSDEEGGVGLIVRRAGVPVGFAMLPSAPGAEVDARELRDAAARASASHIVEAALRDELQREPPAPTTHTVSVAVCTRDRPEVLARCLASLDAVRARSAHRDTLREILVIDNAPSDDRTQKVVASFPGVRYFTEPCAGLDFARNRAWREAHGDLVAYIDDDAVVDDGWLDGLAHAIAVHPDAGAFTGLILPLRLDTEAQRLFEKRGGFRRGFRPWRYARTSPAHGPLYPAGAGIFGAGCNMVVRRDLLQTLGGFDEALDTGAPLPGGGDLDIFYRVVTHGAPLVYEPRALVFHEHRTTLRGLRRQYYTWGLGFLAFVSKTWRTEPAMRPRLSGLVRWWCADMARSIAASLRGTGHTPAHFLLGELWGGVVGLLGEYPRSRRRVAKIKQQAGTA